MNYKKLIIFLIRKRLGLKKFEAFRFSNQLSPDAAYRFTDDSLEKFYPNYMHLAPLESGVSLKWLLSNECKIEKLRKEETDG